jgi:hypothetical protein
MNTQLPLRTLHHQTIALYLRERRSQQILKLTISRRYPAMAPGVKPMLFPQIEPGFAPLLAEQYGGRRHLARH